MKEGWPTTQQFLLDHLRRIVEGVFQTGDPPDDVWDFGFWDDHLVSGEKEIGGDSARRTADIQMFLSLLAIEARDRPGGPTNKNGLQLSYELLGEIFDNPPDSHEFLRRVLPKNTDTDTLQQVYAFEMLQKLEQVADRSKQEAVQTMLFLENVPDGVDDYMAEAAACFRYGFDKACLSVCRTALEESLKRRIADEYGENRIKTVKNDRTVHKDLETLITEAHKQYEYLNGPLAKSANQIRKWGNEAVHGPKNGKISKKEFESRAKKSLLYTKRILNHLWS